MKTIYKYQFQTNDFIDIEMPYNAQILTVQMQYGMPCIWALVDTELKPVKRYFEVFGTGNPIHYDMGVNREYIGTYQQDRFVWHLFERII